jgi:catalase
MTVRLRSESGAPVADNQHSQTAGPGGPVLLQDQHLVEKLARFNRERIPERVVHAVGSGAYGTFVVTNPDVPRWTRMKLFERVGKETEVFARFSTVAGSKGAPDSVRDPRGFALKFYTEEGNWDLAGNNTPVFFLRDPIKFPDFVHSQKYDPFTNQQEPDNVWDFFSHSPEATHQFTWLFGDRGIPAGYRHMNGYGSHTFQWVNAAGERRWVKFHFKTGQGIRCLSDEESAQVAGANPQAHQQDLLQAIERGDFPSWTLKVQLMSEAEAADCRFDPFDLTKVWPHSDHPLIEVGVLTLNRNPDDYFAEVEQAAFSPANFVPGIGPSPDKMLQGRLFAYGDAQRYRLGVNHTRLPVNAPRAVPGGVANYGRDGAMQAEVPARNTRSYEPNSFDGPVQGGEPHAKGFHVSGITGAMASERHAEGDDFGQAGALYRVMSEAERERLVERIGGSLAQVSRQDIVKAAIEHFRKADPEYGARVEAVVAELRSC